MAKTPEQRTNRIREALNNDRADTALSMWRSVPKKQRAEVSSLLGEPFVHKLESANTIEKARLTQKRLQQEAWKRREEQERKYRESEEAKQEAHLLQNMSEYLEEVRAEGGDAAREAAISNWWQEKLDGILKGGEKTSCRQYRKNALWGKHVCAFLNCSQTELDRWDSDGRLSYAIKRDCSPGGKIVKGRMWFAEDVKAALPYIESWREQDAQRKKARRTKLKIA